MLRRFKEERLIFVSTLVLVALGLVMVYSASSVMAMRRYGDAAYFLKRQAVWSLGGLVMLVAAWKTDYRKFRYLSLPALAALFVLLVLALVPGIGAEINGARRWVRLGGFSFQPSEFVKPALLAFLAASLSKRADRLNDLWYGIGPYLLISGTLIFLIGLEPDFGTAAAIAAVVVTMLFVAGARPAHLAMLALPALPVLYIQLFHVSFRMKRLMAFIDPWKDPLGTGFQTIQSFLAFGGGGLTGLGLGEGRQKLLFLPEPHSDFIFSVIGEELGLAGSLTVAALFALFVLCGFRLALRCADPFGRNLAFGLTLMVGLQALVNMGVATGLFPNKGMPLPFVSAGGSSVFVALLSVGMLLSVARVSKAIESGDGLRPAAARR